MTRQKKETFGTARIARVCPKVEDLPTKVLNIDLTLDELLKLRLALDCLSQQMNGHNRSTRAGRGASARLTVYLGGRGSRTRNDAAITVSEGRLPCQRK